MLKALILPVFLVVSGCHSKSKKAGEGNAASTPQQKAKVLTETITEKELSDSLLYPGRVEASAQAGVLAESDGLIRTINTALGRAVKKGDVLLTIENPDPVYKYEPIAVTAPVSGVVSYLDASIGNRVDRSHKLAVIADVRALKVIIEATAHDLPSLKPGQGGVLGIADQHVPVTIAAISPVVDPSTGTASVELRPSSAAFKLLPGMLGRVEFRVRMRKGIQVPDSAVVFKDSDTYLRTVDSGVARWKKVKAGTSAGGLTDILEGAKAGDSLIVRSTTFIADGDAVEIQATKQGEVARQ